MSIIGKAKEYASIKHARQKYGNQPYLLHLMSVVEMLVEHGVSDEKILASAWLHDVLEDTETTKEELVDEFGADIATIVFAVTDEPGKNRKERHEKTYPKTASTPKAGILKLGDRVSNVKHALTVVYYIDDLIDSGRVGGKRGGNMEYAEAMLTVAKQYSLFKMYKKENDEFVKEVVEKSVDKDDPSFISLVKKLTEMMETEKC
jgi:hypothetical protein